MPAFGASTYSYLWKADLSTALTRLAELGFAFAEIMATPPHLAPMLRPNECRDMLGALRRSPIPIVALNPPGQDINLASADEDVRQFAVRMYTGAIRWAAEIGVPWVVIVPGKRHPLLPAPWDVAVAAARRSLEQLLPLAQECGVRLAVENVPAGFLERVPDLLEFVAPYPPECVGIALDVANAHMVEEPATALALAQPRLALVHLSDTWRSRWAHAVIGAGEVDFRSVVAYLHAGASNVSVVLEVIDPDPDVALETSRHALANLGDAFV